ncbi:MAG: hypothetical protein FWF08_08425 [Oscillospiraceae bacterium]|nr:hypothetical protein [Oscillospiraceae bacterium]
MKKKILSAVLCAAMLVSVFSFGFRASAEGEPITLSVEIMHSQSGNMHDNYFRADISAEDYTGLKYKWTVTDAATDKTVYAGWFFAPPVYTDRSVSHFSAFYSPGSYHVFFYVEADGEIIFESEPYEVSAPAYTPTESVSELRSRFNGLNPMRYTESSYNYVKSYMSDADAVYYRTDYKYEYEKMTSIRLAYAFDNLQQIDKPEIVLKFYDFYWTFIKILSLPFLFLGRAGFNPRAYDSYTFGTYI